MQNTMTNRESQQQIKTIKPQRQIGETCRKLEKNTANNKCNAPTIFLHLILSVCKYQGKLSQSSFT